MLGLTQADWRPINESTIRQSNRWALHVMYVRLTSRFAYARSSLLYCYTSIKAEV